jgi:hypothetical protein
MHTTLKRITPPAPIIARLIFAAIVGVLLVVFIGAEAGVGYGAITLVEAAKLSRTELQAGVVETFIINSPILDRAQLLEIQGNAYAYNEEATLPGVEFRAVNGTYTEATGTVNQKSETLVILGGDADVDRYIIQTRGNVNDQKAIQTELKVKAAALKFQDSFFNGDTGVDANSFDGLKKRLTGAQVITAGTNGLAIVGADSAARNLYFDQLDALIASVPGATPDNSAIYANDLVLAKHSSAARRETINDRHLQRAPVRVRRQGPRRAPDQAVGASQDRGIPRSRTVRREGRRPPARTPQLLSPPATQDPITP